MTSLTIAMCQTNPVTGDFVGNFRQAERAVHSVKADVYVFPECHVSNYAAGDLFLDGPFLRQCEAAYAPYARLSEEADAVIVFGVPLPAGPGAHPFNAAVVADRGKLSRVIHKRMLPNYGVFDDARWFSLPANRVPTFHVRAADGSTVTLGACICEDLWHREPIADIKAAGAEIAVALNSSPFSIGKPALRRKVFMDRIRENGIPLVYVNQCGGNDELLWDGRSAAADPDGRIAEMPAWREGVATARFERDTASGGWRLAEETPPVELPHGAELYVAACIGLRDYLAKTGFKNAVLGLSGGADSALVLLMAADVLGAGAVHSVLMPTVYTSNASNSLAAALADGIGSPWTMVAIQSMFEESRRSFASAYGDTEPNVAEENLQAQLRGDVLSWHSNKFGAMILSTGNKSEAAMGYATLYGDMRGGFNPLKDLYKTEVFDLLEARLAAAGGDDRKFASAFAAAFGKDLASLGGEGQAALRAIIDRPPSAELADGQFDSDSLPAYPVLDAILKAIVDNKDSLTDREVSETTGHPEALVAAIRRRLRTMEYKRFQSCPGPKIHMRSFTSKDWRMPMASAWKG